MNNAASKTRTIGFRGNNDSLPQKLPDSGLRNFHEGQETQALKTQTGTNWQTQNQYGATNDAAYRNLENMPTKQSLVAQAAYNDFEEEHKPHMQTIEQKFSSTTPGGNFFSNQLSSANQLTSANQLHTRNELALGTHDETIP